MNIVLTITSTTLYINNELKETTKSTTNILGYSSYYIVLG